MTKAAGLLFEQHATTPSWGDYDNDGRPDLYVAGFLVNVTHYPDHLFHNGGAGGPRFDDVLPALVNEHDASHGVQWVDFDDDGALDLALTNNDPAGGHYLFRNLLPARASPAVARDRRRRRRGRHTKPGAEVRVYAAGTRRLISSGLVDTGGGYCSQNVMPVHVGTAGAARVDVEVTTMGKGGRRDDEAAASIRRPPDGRSLRITDSVGRPSAEAAGTWDAPSLASLSLLRCEAPASDRALVARQAGT